MSTTTTVLPLEFLFYCWGFRCTSHLRTPAKKLKGRRRSKALGSCDFLTLAVVVAIKSYSISFNLNIIIPLPVGVNPHSLISSTATK